MHFTAKLLKIKYNYFPRVPSVYQFGKYSQTMLLNFTCIFCTVAIISCSSFTEYVVSMICFSYWSIVGHQNAVILKCTPVRQPIGCIIYRPPHHKLSEAFFSDKEDTLNEVSSGSGEAWLKSISSSSGGKSDSSAWVRKINFFELVCGHIFFQVYVYSCGPLVLIYSDRFRERSTFFSFQDFIQYLT